MAFLSILALAATVYASPQQPDLDKYVYPLAPYKACPPVKIEFNEYPKGEKWLTQAKAIVEVWYPTVRSLLATQDSKVPSEIILRVKQEKNMPPAYASGNSITVSGDWITAHPDDLGMIVHELTHVIQNYPGARTTPGWLVEGIADYIRWWRYEPEVPRSRIDTTKANYTDAYRTTAFWLAWVSQKYDRRLVPALDGAMRKREDPMPIFEKMTGKDAPALWKEFVEFYNKTYTSGK